MKKSIRFTGILLCLAILFTGTIATASFAADTVIDVTNAADGYFTVNYAGTARMKVAVTFNGVTKYSDYTPGTAANYAFTEGNGSYVIRLYQNLEGTSYKKVASASVDVTMKKDNAQYLVSTNEIGFAANGTVAAKAAELCKDKKNNAEKIVAIYQFLLGFSYDYSLAGKISSGEIVIYTPDTAAVLESGKGICYDLSALFAALCRSQGIPCKLVKGTCNNASHAWNEVLCGSTWYRIDMTYSIRNGISAETVPACVTPLTGYAA